MNNYEWTYYLRKLKFNHNLDDESDDSNARFYSKVVPTVASSLDNSYIASRITKERSEFRQETIESILKIYDSILREALLEGYSFSTGNFNIKASIKGGFSSLTDSYNDTRNYKTFSISPNQSLKNALKDVKVKKMQAPALIEILSIKDGITGSTNGDLTPNGYIIIEGKGLKLLANNDENENESSYKAFLNFIAQDDESSQDVSVDLSKTYVPINTDKKLQVNLPKNIYGKFKIELKTLTKATSEPKIVTYNKVFSLPKVNESL